MANHRILQEGLGAIGLMQGGAVDEQFRRHVRRAVLDCDDRPGDDKPRKVILELQLTPVLMAEGHAPNVSVEARLKSTVPDHVSRPTEARLLHGGDLMFNDLSEDNPDQRTIDQPAQSD